MSPDDPRDPPPPRDEERGPEEEERRGFWFAFGQWRIVPRKEQEFVLA